MTMLPKVDRKMSERRGGRGKTPTRPRRPQGRSHTPKHHKEGKELAVNVSRERTAHRSCPQIVAWRECATSHAGGTGAEVEGEEEGNGEGMHRRKRLSQTASPRVRGGCLRVQEARGGKGKARSAGVVVREGKAKQVWACLFWSKWCVGGSSSSHSPSRQVRSIAKVASSHLPLCLS